MIGDIFLIIIFKFLFFCECISKKYVLLPYNSVLCSNATNGINKYFEFTISQQLNFETNSNISSVLNLIQSSNISDLPSYLPLVQVDNNESYFYFCRALVKPAGRPLEIHHEKGLYSFWNTRTRIDSIKPSRKCSDNLLLQFRHKDDLNSDLESHSVNVTNITCKHSLPIIIPSSIRKLYITYFSIDPDSSGFNINVTSFIFFQSDFPIFLQQDLCRHQEGFWCGNETNTCIYRGLNCDGSDSCFDGGSDESDCPLVNLTKNTNNNRNKNKTLFIDYLPWLALGILPLILLMALVCICNQHRSEVFFDDDEDNLDIEKSQEDHADHIWSSIDGLDQLEKTIEEKNEIQDNLDDDNHSSDIWKEPLIGLQTVFCPTTVKADISASCTANSLSKNYEDIDQSLVCPKNEGESPKIDDHNKTIYPNQKPLLLLSTELTDSLSNPMTASQITDEDYILEDVGSLLRKVDKTKSTEKIRLDDISTTVSSENTTKKPQKEAVLDYRSDYILV